MASNIRGVGKICETRMIWPERPVGRQVEIVDHAEEEAPGKIAGEHEAGRADDKRQSADEAALGPQHGTSGDLEQQQLGVVLAVVDGQQGKRRDGGQGESDSGRSGARSQGDKYP